VVIEAGRAIAMAMGSEQRVRHTRIFLRIAAIELRRIAERAPEITVELRHVAQQLEAEAEDLGPVVAVDRAEGEDRCST